MSTSDYEPIPGEISSYRDVPELIEYFLEDVQRTRKRLGAGAFGIVEELMVGGTLCAGKKLHSSLLDAHNDGTDKLISRFISECKLMSRIRHPNIVQFMGLCQFQESDHPALVMEKVDVNLESILENHKNLPLLLIIRLLKDIARALIYLHCQKPPIIHRDLTARNVLVSKASMTAKISDLGNALMVDPVKLSTTLSQTPGTLPYMPPEALLARPQYDCMLDMFSFGHLTLYAIIQESPGNLLPPTYTDPKTDKLEARSEVERRDQYIRQLFDKLTVDHVVTKMVLQCLHNVSNRRLTASAFLDKLNKVYANEEDPYDEITFNYIIDKSDEEKGNIQSVSPIKRRIEDFKAGAIGVIDIYRLHGRFIKREDWRSHLFQIKDGHLKYFKSNNMDRPHDQLELSSVVKVRAIPPKENKSMFHFEIYFSASSTSKGGSPWLLRAYTQDDRACWMEAIEPGSSATIKPVSPGAYEDVFSDTDSDPVKSGEYSYTSDLPPEAATIYDEPDTGTSVTLHPVKQQASSQLAGATTINPDKSSTSEPPQMPSYIRLIKQPEDASKCFNIGNDDEDEDGKIYDDVEILQESTDELYEELSPDTGTVSPPRRSSTVPKIMHEVSEISLENIHSLDPKEAQLWMLVQMQKMIQKMEDVYETARPSSAGKWQNSALKKAPDSHLTSKEKENLYVNDFEMPSDQQPTRKDLYVNLDAISEALAGTPGPAPSVPPKTYRSVSDESNDGSHRTNTEQCQATFTSEHDHNAYSAVGQRSLTISEENRREEKPTDKVQADPPPVDLHDVPKKKTPGIFKSLIQKTETSADEMISTLKAGSMTISSGIESHLVTDDDEQQTYAPGKRPEWTKAKTQSSGLEPSLAALQQKALFLPRSTIQDLQEIGHGQYGKVFHGYLRRSGGPGNPVAIKTIRQYESEKERDNFLKEMNIMSKLMHPNIVRLFGLVQQDEPWIVLEYLPHGDLKNFLMKSPQPTDKLFKYMLDVATGMHYISEKGLVHRDLAARNVMVSHDEICKVGDFGLLREIPKDVEIYVAKTKVAFPIRWMAPESLMKKEFSPASDVWSFGVVMWEMYNPKGKPYKGMDNIQVATNVNQGMRLPIPEPYPPTVVSIMKACWQHSSSKRPSFLLIASLLTNNLMYALELTKHYYACHFFSTCYIIATCIRVLE